MQNTAVRNSLVAALGGFLFGFDTAVISGVEKTIQEFWSLSASQHSLTTSSALIGTVIGALIAGRPTEFFGRKKVLQTIGLLYLVTSLVTALTSTWEIFVLFRFLGGIGVGASSVAGPMYISEISPAASRGRLVALFQFNVVTGILIAFVSNYLLFSIGEDSWRLMLGVQAIPSIIYFVLVFFVPESPRWLVKQHRTAEGLKVLQAIGEPEPDKALKQIEQSLQNQSGKKESVFSKAYTKPVTYAVLLAMFNQLSGINAIMYFAPRIFEMTGLAKDTSLLQAVSIGATNLVFTLLAISLIDKFGRKTLLLIGSFGMVVTLGLVARAFYLEAFDGYSVMIYLVGFIAFFAFSQGAVIWVFISEIFPNAVRSQGQTLGSSTHWIMAAAITYAFPRLVDKNPIEGGFIAFLVFAIMMALHGFFVWKFLPETKGKSLEGISDSIRLH